MSLELDTIVKLAIYTTIAEPGHPSRIRMAPPFSGVPTAFPVETRGKRYYANCAWDALGIPAALHEDAVIPAADAFTGERLTLEVKAGRAVPQECVIHFAVPAARWWEDIIYTCATMLLFRSEEMVGRWCQAHHVP